MPLFWWMEWLAFEQFPWSETTTKLRKFSIEPKCLYLHTYAGMHLKILHVSTKLTPSLSVPVFVKDVIDQYHKPPKWDVVIHIFSVSNWILWRTRRTILGEIYSYSPSHITHESCIQGTRFEWFPFLVHSHYIYVWSLFASDTSWLYQPFQTLYQAFGRKKLELWHWGTYQSRSIQRYYRITSSGTTSMAISHHIYFWWKKSYSLESSNEDDKYATFTKVKLLVSWH